MRSANLRRLLAAIWSDPLGRRWLLLSQAALVGQVVFDLAIPLAIRQIVNNGILAGNFDKGRKPKPLRRLLRYLLRARGQIALTVLLSFAGTTLALIRQSRSAFWPRTVGVSVAEAEEPRSTSVDPLHGDPDC